MYQYYERDILVTEDSMYRHDRPINIEWKSRQLLRTAEHRDWHTILGQADHMANNIACDMCTFANIVNANVLSFTLNVFSSYWDNYLQYYLLIHKLLSPCFMRVEKIGMDAEIREILWEKIY